MKLSAWLTEKARRDLGWLPSACHKRTITGFTLAELLISMAILGVIATFTIPKILSSQQNESYNAKAKEAASMISEAYQIYSLNNVTSSSTKLTDLTPYMNYVAIDATSSLDAEQGSGSLSCSDTAVRRCLKLHNGGMLHIGTQPLGGTGILNALNFGFDPDGKVTDGTTNGPGKSVGFILYYNGRITTYGTAATGTILNATTFSANPALDPPWFSW